MSSVDGYPIDGPEKTGQSGSSDFWFVSDSRIVIGILGYASSITYYGTSRSARCNGCKTAASVASARCISCMGAPMQPFHAPRAAARGSARYYYYLIDG
jgi:hypothetical protein